MRWMSGRWLNKDEPDYDKLLNDLKVEQQRLENARQVNIDLRQEIDALQKEKASLQDHANSWRETCGVVADQRLAIRIEKNRLRMRNDDLTVQLETMTADRDQLAGYVDEIKDDRDYYKTLTGDLKAEIARHLITIDDLRKDLVDWRKMCSTYTEEIATLTMSNQQLEKEAKDQATSSTYWSEECDRLRKEVADMEAEMERRVKAETDRANTWHSSAALLSREKLEAQEKLKQVTEGREHWLVKHSEEVVKRRNLEEALEAEIEVSNSLGDTIEKYKIKYDDMVYQYKSEIDDLKKKLERAELWAKTTSHSRNYWMKEADKARGEAARLDKMLAQQSLYDVDDLVVVLRSSSSSQTTEVVVELKAEESFTFDIAHAINRLLTEQGVPAMLLVYTKEEWNRIQSRTESSDSTPTN